MDKINLQRGHMEAIIVDSVTKEYGHSKVVDDLSFKVHKGSIHGFLGPNGAGKTTTMKMIAGVIPPTTGTIYINGKNIQKDLYESKKKLGVLLENPPLYKDMEVREYLEFVSKLHKQPWNKVKESVDYSLEKLNITDVQNRIIGNLSKGYKQRVGVAQAIVFNPDIVILDEPTVGLDPGAVIEMRELISEIGKDHTVLLSSHLLHEISLICNNLTIIQNGRLQASGTLAEIKSKVRGKNIIHAKIKGSHISLIQSLNSYDFIGHVEYSTSESSTDLKIYTNSISDHREEISKCIFNHDLSLLEFVEEKMSLEKIFLKVTEVVK
jgi:ABC-2 type transport system ATP-binding protein